MKKEMVSLREMSDEELKNALESAEKEYFELKMKRGRGETLENPMRLRILRRSIARILTVIRERELKKV